MFVRKIPFPLSALAAIFVLVGLTYAQTAIQIQEGSDEQDIISATPPIAVDTSGTTPGPGSPTGSGRPPRVGANRQVNDVQQGPPHGLFGRSETSVAATTDGQFLVFGWNDAQGFCGPPFNAACTPPTLPGLSGFGFSSDGGNTYVDGGAPPVINHAFSRGDPWLDLGGFDNATFYYANLSVNDTTAANLGVSVHRGHFTNGVLNWEDMQVFNAPGAPNDLYDKEAIATAKDGSGAGYVSVTNFIEVCGFPQAGAGQIEVWRTHDGGVSWQGPAVVSADTTSPSSGPDCGSTQTLQQSSVPAIGPNGELYVVWQFGPTFTVSGTSTNANIYFSRSLDGGVTFSTPTSVAAINSFRQDTPVGYNRDRMNDHPRIAVATSGVFKGRIYVTYYSAVDPVTAAPISACVAPVTGFCRAQRLTDSNVFIVHSDDGGATWSSPMALGSLLTSGSSGTKRWWPVVTVEPTGNVDVVYYESQETATGTNCSVRVGTRAGQPLRRFGPASSLVNTLWTQSTNGGATFSTPVNVSLATTNWCTTVSNITPNFGDYIGSASGGNHVNPSWADGRNGVPDVFTAPILGSGKSH
jgi:hypothetical protein